MFFVAVIGHVIARSVFYLDFYKLSLSLLSSAV